MSEADFLDSYFSKDPTWHYAYHYVRKHFDVPSHMFRLFRSGWHGEIEPIEYVKVIGFSHLNPRCLIQAAELSGNEDEGGRGSVERAIRFLGIRFSAVVLAIHLYTHLLEKKNPDKGWDEFLKAMMTNVEMGYRFGTQVGLIGSEGGALVGFSKTAGLGLMIATNNEKYIQYKMLLKQNGKVTPEEEIKLFGCQLYQLSTLIVQQLGFGTEFAMSIPLASGCVEVEELDIPERTFHWEGAHMWVAALAEQRNYPSDLKHREMFREIKPPPSGTSERNRRLETLYTDIGKLNQNESEWSWHLPSTK